MKPVYYVVENIEFDKPIYVLYSRCNVIFKNCLFKDHVFVRDCKELIFENNVYLPSDKTSYLYKKEGYFGISIKDVESIGFTLEHVSTDGVMNLSLNAKRIEMKDTYIHANDIQIEANDVNIESSQFNLDGLDISAKNVDLCDSSIFSSVVSFEGLRNCQGVDILCDSIFINRIESDANNIDCCAKNLDLQKKRIELLQIFKKIQATCDGVIDDRLQDKMVEIKRQPLKRILKK